MSIEKIEKAIKGDGFGKVWYELTPEELETYCKARERGAYNSGFMKGVEDANAEGMYDAGIEDGKKNFVSDGMKSILHQEGSKDE